MRIFYVFSSLQVIVHTAIRTKVPFKKKVRGERGHKSSSSKPKATVGGKTIPSGSAGATAGNSAAIISSAAATTVVMTNTSGGVNTKLFKRQTLNPSDISKKGAKKKKRVAAPVVDEDQHKIQPTTDATPLKTKNQKKSKSKHKEVIDYSKQNHSNTFGKVQKWLLESPIVAQPAAAEGITSTAEVEHASKVRNIMSKSQSTPERLALRSPKKVQSVSNLNDKVKLQVVYKPPFKFSLKLSKNSAVKTKVLGGGGGGVSRNKRKTRTDKVSQETAALAAAIGGRRTGLLVRTTSITDNNSVMPTTMAATVQQPQSVLQQAVNNTGEPNYETLNSKRDVVPVYENVNVASKDAIINSATFRINRSASGSNITKQLNHSMSSPHQFSHSSSSSKARGSSSNINLISAASGGQSSSADLSCGANTQFGSSQNLIRSSTTNLSKTNRNSFDIKRGGQDLSRSSTTNLSKDRRHGSHANLYRQRNAGGGSNGNLQFDEIPPSSRSRKNSNSMKQSQSPDSTASKTSIPRVPSNSNLKIPSLRRGSISNIPRANLKTNSFNQHSRFNGPLTPQQQQQQHQHHQAKRNGTADQISIGRPHTSDCTDGTQFEWPQRYIADKMSKDEPLPSDLEVMVSDVENLVNDV